MNLQEMYEAQIIPPSFITPKDLAKKLGIVPTMEFRQSSHGLYDMVPKVTTQAAGGYRRINGGLHVLSMNTGDVRIDLFPFGGILEVDSQLVDNWPGGLEAYIEQNMPQYAKGIAQSYETSLIYGNESAGIAGLREIAKNNNAAVPTNAAGTGTDYTSIIFVTWDEQQCTGLFNENGFNEGMFVPEIQNDGRAVLVPEFDESGNYTGKKKSVYQFKVEFPTGLKVIGGNHVYVISGIKDADGYRVTESMVRTALAYVGANPESTFIYVNGVAKSQLNALKSASVKTDNTDRNILVSANAIDDCRIVVCELITNTEAREV